MNTSQIPLELVKVASPCKASWDGMVGDDRARFCGQCSQYVFNLSELTQEEAEALITEHEGKMCLRFYQRIDGTIMTKDCPVGWRAIKRRITFISSAVAAVFVAAVSLLILGAFGNTRDNRRVRMGNPIQRIYDRLFPPPVCVMGEPLPAPAVIAPGQPQPAIPAVLPEEQKK